MGNEAPPFGSSSQSSVPTSSRSTLVAQVSDKNNRREAFRALKAARSVIFGYDRVDAAAASNNGVAIARAIVTEPSAILADEPTAALDSVNGHETKTILSAVAKKLGRAVLVVTPDARLSALADQIVHNAARLVMAEPRQ